MGKQKSRIRQILSTVEKRDAVRRQGWRRFSRLSLFSLVFLIVLAQLGYRIVTRPQWGIERVVEIHGVGPVDKAEVLPNGQTLAVFSRLVSSVNPMRTRFGLHELSSGKLIREMIFDLNVEPGEHDEVSSDARRFLQLVSATGNVEQDPAVLWDLESGNKIWSVPGLKIDDVRILPGGRQFLTEDNHGALRIRNLEDGSFVRLLEFSNGTSDTIKISADGTRLLRSFSTDRARVWDIESGAVVYELELQDSHLDSAAFSPDGKYVFTTSHTGHGQLWNAKTAASIRRFRPGPEKRSRLVYSPDGSSVLAGDGNPFFVFDPWSGRTVSRMETAGTGLAARFVLGGRYILATDILEDRSILWDSQTGAEIVTWEQYVRAMPGDTKLYARERRNIQIWAEQYPPDWAGYFHRIEVWAAAIVLLGWLILLRHRREADAPKSTDESPTDSDASPA